MSLSQFYANYFCVFVEKQNQRIIARKVYTYKFFAQITDVSWQCSISSLPGTLLIHVITFFFDAQD